MSAATIARGLTHRLPCSLLVAALTLAALAITPPPAAGQGFPGAPGGKSWIALPLYLMSGPSDITCPTAMDCTIVGQSDLILLTADGGATWHLPLQRPAMAGIVDYSAVSCPSPSTCFAIGWVKSIGGAIITSADHGATWTLAWSGGTRWRDLACPTITTCYAIGGNNVIATDDGGAAWSARPYLKSWPMNLLSFPSESCRLDHSLPSFNPVRDSATIRVSAGKWSREEIRLIVCGDTLDRFVRD